VYAIVSEILYIYIYTFEILYVMQDYLKIYQVCLFLFENISLYQADFCIMSFKRLLQEIDFAV